MLREMLDPATYYLNMNVIPYLVLSMAVIFAGLYFFLNDRKNRTKKIFLFFSVSIFLWLFGTWMGNSTRVESLGILWGKVVYVGVSFIPATFYWLSVEYLRLHGQRNMAYLSVLVSSGFAIISFFTDFIVGGIRTYSWGFFTSPGVYHQLLLYYFAIFLAFVTVNFYLIYRGTLSQDEKSRIKIILIATCISYTAGIEFLPAYGIDILPIAYIPVSAFFGLVAYAVFKRTEVKLAYLTEIMWIFIGSMILAANYMILPKLIPEEIYAVISSIINMIGAMVAIVPPALIFYGRYKESKEVEDQFAIFITDLTEAIDSGMTLPLALKYCGNREYGILTPRIKSMTAQVDWGIPFREALKIFSNNVDSPPVKRSITTIIETYKVGGKISDTMKAVSESLMQINRIKAERSVSVQSQILTSYLIFFVFIFILVILQSFLIPALTPKGDIEGVVGLTGGQQIEVFPPDMFVNFILIQGLFAGLATGKMAEGSIMAGIKHSILLIAVGYTIFSLTSQFQISFI